MKFSQRSAVLLMRIRFFSTPSNGLGNEIEKIKPFITIPTLSPMKLIQRSLPGGKYYKKSMNEIIKLFNEECGDIVRLPALLGQPEVIMTFKPENFEKVFRVEGTWPERMGFDTLRHYRLKKRPDIYDEYEGLITSQDEKWHRMRTIANPILMQPKVVKLYTSQVDKISSEFVEIMKKLRDDQSEMPKNFADYVNAWSLESVTAIALEKRLGVMSENTADDKARELIKLIREFFVQSVEFEGKLSVWKYYETKSFKQLMEVYDGITNIILHYIDEATKDMKNNESLEGHEKSILRKFLKINKKAAVAMVSDFLLAGVDTTASSTIFILYCLAKNPDKQELLRQEIMNILPSKEISLTIENMKNMPYLRACIKESMRLYPIVVGTVRKIHKDIVLSGYQVPVNSTVSMISIFELRNPAQFEKPDSFMPERWLRVSKEEAEKCPIATKAHNPYAFIPFGFGSRMCVGRRLAEIEMETLVSRILRNFKLEWHHGDIKIKETLVNIPISEMRFKVLDL